MANIRTFEEFTNQFPMEDSLNEGLISNIKGKIFEYFNRLSLNDQIKFVDKIERALYNTTVSSRFGLLFYILLLIFDTFSKKFNVPFSLTLIVNGFYWLIIYYTQIKYGRKIKDLRVETIQARLSEIRNEFSVEWLKYMFVILGEKENVDACVERLIRDGIITEKNINETFDGTILIDFTENFTKKIKVDRIPSNVEVDPFGEEAWTEEEEKELEKERNLIDKNSILGYYRSQIIPGAERLFNVQFRSLRDLQDYRDGRFKTNGFLSFKRKEKHRQVKNHQYDIIKRNILGNLKEVEEYGDI